MSNFEICNFEEFVAEVTPQSGSLEEAASANEIFIQQVEGYLQRMKAAMCRDILTLEAQISAGGGGGGEAWKISEMRQEATAALPSTFPHVPWVFDTAGINDAPGELQWDAVAGGWENISGATLYVNVLCTIACQNVSSGRPAFSVLQDVGGTGTWAELAGSNFWSEFGRMSASKVYRVDMGAGDLLAIGARTIVGSTNMIAGSSFQLLSRTTAV